MFYWLSEIFYLAFYNCFFNMIGYTVTPDKPLELNQNWSCMYDTKVGNYTISEKLVSILCETECNKINQFQLEFNSTVATLKDGKLIVTNKLNKTKEIYVLTEMFIVKDDPLGYIP